MSLRRVRCAASAFPTGVGLESDTDMIARALRSIRSVPPRTSCAKAAARQRAHRETANTRRAGARGRAADGTEAVRPWHRPHRRGRGVAIASSR